MTSKTLNWALRLFICLCFSFTWLQAEIKNIHLLGQPDKDSFFIAEEHFNISQAGLSSSLFIFKSTEDQSTIRSGNHLKISGELQSIWYENSGNLLLTFKNSLFRQSTEDFTDQGRQLLQLAPSEQEFLSSFTNNKGLYQLLKEEQKLFLQSPSGNQQALDLDILKEPHLAFRTQPADGAFLLYIESYSKKLDEAPQQRLLSIVIPTSNDPKIITRDLSEFGTPRFSRVASDIYIFPPKGREALMWSSENESIQDLSLDPFQLGSQQRWISAGATTLGLYFISEKENTLFLREPDSGTDIQYYQVQTDHLQTLITLFQNISIFMMMFVILFILRRKVSPLSTFPLENPTLKQKSSIRPANMYLRGMAHFLDGPIIIYFVIIHSFSTFLQKQEVLLNDQLRAGLLLDPPAWTIIIHLYIFYLIYIFLSVCYLTVIESMTSSSLGKMFFNLKVVQLDGTRPSFKQVLIRQSCRIIDYFWIALIFIFIDPTNTHLSLHLLTPIGLFICFSNSKRQCLGDLLAGTIVVENRPLEQNQKD